MTIRILLFASLFLGLAAPAVAQPSNKKTRIAPETYLRGYDPITVFLKKDTGRRGAVDQPVE